MRKTSLAMRESITTDRLTKQIVLGESLLDFLYPDLNIDLRGDACPQCSNMMKEDDIISGWQPCEFQDFTTRCPQCGHRFVPRFSVLCNSPTFEGSQGPGTPLYCEFLSPWVLRKELNHIITGDGGIDLILDPEWRSGTDVRATLWWNMIAMFKRYQLPFSFLLQGSFQNRLISPVPQD
jgi:DNA-directed RNA polymerase subunit RPC12/RpoP